MDRAGLPQDGDELDRSQRKDGERLVGWASGPNGEHVISLIRSSDRVFKCILDLTGRTELIASQELVSLQKRIRDAVESIDPVVLGSPTGRPTD